MPSVLGRKMMAWGVIWLWIWGGKVGGRPQGGPRPGVPLHPLPCQAYVHRDVDVVAVPRVHIHSVEAGAGAIDDLEPLALLYRQVHQQRAVREVSKGLWGEKGLRGFGQRSQTLEQRWRLRLGLP